MCVGGDCVKLMGQEVDGLKERVKEMTRLVGSRGSAPELCQSK